MSIGALIAGSSAVSAAASAFVVRIADEIAQGSNAASIIANSAIFVTALVAAILSLRNGWKQDAVKKDLVETKAEIVSKVDGVDTKIVAVTEQVTEVAKHTNSMKDDLMQKTKELATLIERQRGEDAGRKDVEDKRMASEADIKSRQEGATEERARHTKEEEEPKLPR
jgi:hypothetical protein